MRAGDPGRRHQMTVRSRTLTAAALCVALCAAAGCGSSGDSSTSGSGGAVSTGGSANSSSTSSTASSGGTTTKGAGKPPASGGLKYNTTPKYATPSSSAPVQSGVVQIAYRNIAIDPDTLRVKVGSTVRWTNYDPVEHNVTSKGGPDHFASKTFAEGGTVEYKLTKPGIVHYVCTIHPTTMNGTIEVVK